jgi:hypothetical protein
MIDAGYLAALLVVYLLHAENCSTQAIDRTTTPKIIIWFLPLPQRSTLKGTAVRRLNHARRKLWSAPVVRRERIENTDRSPMLRQVRRDVQLGAGERYVKHRVIWKAILMSVNGTV